MKLMDWRVLTLCDYLVNEGKDEDLINQYLAQAAMEGVVDGEEAVVEGVAAIANVNVEAQQNLPVAEDYAVANLIF